MTTQTIEIETCEAGDTIASGDLILMPPCSCDGPSADWRVLRGRDGVGVHIGYLVDLTLDGPGGIGYDAFTPDGSYVGHAADILGGANLLVTVRPASRMSESMRVHKLAAGKLPRRPAKPQSGPVETLTVHRGVWATALRLADGNTSRIKIVSSRRVEISQ